MCSVYFNLKFLYENVLNEEFKEELSLAKSKQKLPVVINKTEIKQLFEATANIKHPLIALLCRFAFDRS